MVKITKNGKRSLKTLGVSVNPKYWDFERDKPKSNCPNRTYIVSIITNALQKYQAIQLDMETKCEDYTASEILNDAATKPVPVTVEDFLTEHIQQLRENGKIGNSYAYLNLRTTLHNFYGKKLNFLFNAVDVPCRPWPSDRGSCVPLVASGKAERGLALLSLLRHFRV